jgi:hypothetical protein
VALPPLTPEQRAEALQKAAIARKERAEVKNRLKRGAVTLSEVIKDGSTDDVIGKMKVPASARSAPSRSWSDSALPSPAACEGSVRTSAPRLSRSSVRISDAVSRSGERSAWARGHGRRARR